MATAMMAPTFAADKAVVVKTLEAGTVAQGEGTTYNSSTGTTYYHVYKITVPSGGYLTFTNNNYSSKAQTYYLYRAKNTVISNYSGYYAAPYSQTAQKTVSVPVKTGTYYIYASGSHNFKYTYTKVALLNSNYCRGRATTLNAGVTKTICCPYGYQYDHWYKVTLSSAKALTITFRDLTIYYKDAAKYPKFELYKANGDVVSIDQKSGFAYSSTKLSKGTYYIRMIPTVSASAYNQKVYQLKWS